MPRFQCLAIGAICVSSVYTLPTNAPQHLDFEATVKEAYDVPLAVDRAQAVVDTFKLSWEGYYTYAFPNDELKPVTNGFSNSR